MPDAAATVREISFGDAIREALAEEMRRDPRIVLFGEDVAEAGTVFKVLKGRATFDAKRRSAKRVVDYRRRLNMGDPTSLAAGMPATRERIRIRSGCYSSPSTRP